VPVTRFDNGHRRASADQESARKDPHKKRENMLFRPLHYVLTSALVGGLACFPAHGASPASSEVANPMAAELSRFVRDYRVAEATSMQVKMQIAAQERKPGADRAFLECINSRLRPEMYEDLAYGVAATTFHDPDRLRAINAFFESPAGRIMTDSAITWLADSERRAEEGLAPAPMPEPAMTASERRSVEAWSRSPGHEDFQRFIDPGLRTLGSNPQATAVLKSVATSCRS